MFEQFWSIGLLLLPAIASYWQKWNYLYMAISFPTIILIGFYPLIPNSPRWLLQRGRIEEAKEILLQAGKMNGKHEVNASVIQKQLEIQAKDMANAPKEPKYWAIWKGKVKNIICIHFAWSAYIIVYYGFLLNIRNFGVYFLEENTIICGRFKIILNLIHFYYEFFIGLSELLGTFIGLYLILNTKYKWQFAGIFNIVSSFISLSAWLIPKTGR